MHLQEAHSYRPIAQFWLASPSRTQVKCGKDLLERSQQLVAVSQEKIQEDAHVEDALRACGYPAWSFSKVRRQMEFKGDKRKKKELEMWANAQRDGRPAEYR